MAIKIRHTNRYREIVVALVRHGFGYMVEEMGLLHILSLPRKWFLRETVQSSKTLGERIRLVLEELGPTFIKLGQLASTRHDLLPDDLIHELQKLQDQVPPFSVEEVHRILEEEWQVPMGEILAEFREIPLAAASIGQVHYGLLKTGEAVAIKVQRPSVNKLIELDLSILQELAALAEGRVKWVARYRVRAIVDELTRSMREELNYTHEGKNMDKVGGSFAQHPYVCIPKVYWSFTTSKVLMMEYVEGVHLNDREELAARGYDRKKIAENVVNAMLHQMLIEGFFHADPHPGNLFVLPGEKIAFVDFGLVGRLNEEMKDHLCSLVIALQRKDSDGIVKAIQRLGLISEEADTAALRKDLDRLRDDYYDIPFSEVSLGRALNELFAVAHQHSIMMPTDLTLLGKALLTLEGVAEKLDPELSLVKLAEPFGRRLIKERFHPKRLHRKWQRNITDFMETISSFPRHASQLSKMVRTGKLKVEIGIPEIELLLRKMDQVSNRISISIVLLSFSIIMVGLIIASSLGKVPAIIQYFHVIEVGSTVAGLMLLWLLYSIFKSGRF